MRAGPRVAELEPASVVDFGCGDGRQTRSFCYVDDLIDACIKLMDTGDEVTGPVNVGNPVETTIRTFSLPVSAVVPGVNTLAVEVQRAGQAADEQRLGEARDALEEHVPARQQRDEQRLLQACLTDDLRGERCGDRLDGLTGPEELVGRQVRLDDSSNVASISR